jgi:hypothetical protein
LLFVYTSLASTVGGGFGHPSEEYRNEQ